MANVDTIGTQRSSSLHSIPEAEGEIGTHISVESAPEGRPVAAGTAWEENTSSCGVCGTRFQKRRMTRRHHCRICGKCVCSACSPSTVQLEGYSKVQRACTPCVAGATQAMAATDRLFLLAERLERTANADKHQQIDALERREETTQDHAPEVVPSDQARGRRLEDAVGRCEAAAEPLEGLRARLVAAEARAARAQEETRDLAKCPTGEQCSETEALDLAKRVEPEVLDSTVSAPEPDARNETTPTMLGRQDWQENTLACSLCATTFSPFKRRHHCRVCGLCVCITCSPGRVQIEGQQQPQRACTRCVAQQQALPDAPELASELTLPC